MCCLVCRMDQYRLFLFPRLQFSFFEVVGVRTVVVGRCRATIADVFLWFLFLHFAVVGHVVHGILSLPPFLLSWVFLSPLFYISFSFPHSSHLPLLSGEPHWFFVPRYQWFGFLLPMVPIVVPSLFCCVIFSVVSWLQFHDIHVMY